MIQQGLPTISRRRMQRLCHGGTPQSAGYATQMKKHVGICNADVLLII
jgi:hypothetical protein